MLKTIVFMALGIAAGFTVAIFMGDRADLAPAPAGGEFSGDVGDISYDASVRARLEDLQFGPGEDHRANVPALHHHSTSRSHVCSQSSDRRGESPR